MVNFLYLFFGIFLGSVIMFFAYKAFRLNRKRELVEKQSIILLEKIKTVAKLVVVEGEFSEIYHHENDKEYLFGMISSKKKALLLVNAKVHIGFDLKKVILDSDTFTKRIILKEFSQPEVLSFENNYKFYDIDEGIFNKFSPEEISKLNDDAKQFVLDKIPDSTLMQTARKEALQTIKIMENIVETIGWKLDYSTLKIDASQKHLLN
jgi:Protein of unknown function (DUF4230)